MREGLPMWTSKNRGQFDHAQLRYPSDVADAEWDIASLIPPAKRGGLKRAINVRVVGNGLMAR